MNAGFNVAAPEAKLVWTAQRARTQQVIFQQQHPKFERHAQKHNQIGPEQIAPGTAATASPWKGDMRMERSSCALPHRR